MTRCRGSKVRENRPDVIVVGAGIAGLAAAAPLAKNGARVQVVERHALPGGCASFYVRAGYRFDVGATLISGFGLAALPADLSGLTALVRALQPRHLTLVGAIGRTVAHILPPGADAKLRAFVDAQLLITAQSDAASTDLAYGATALDIAREGTFHLAAGVAEISIALARVIRRAGGQIAYGTAVAGFALKRQRVCGVIDCATPHTFAAYAGRTRGLVGGLPQTPANANLRALSHRSGIAGLTLCGDSVFPGQSTVGASLSGVAAANAVSGAAALRGLFVTRTRVSPRAAR